MVVARIWTCLVGACILAGCVPGEMESAGLTLPPTVVLAPAPAPEPEAEAEPEPETVTVAKREVPPQVAAYYAARPDGDRTLPAVDAAEFHPMLLRSQVALATTEAPGTVVIDTAGPFLYLVEPAGQATRYGIAIGREGFGWTGTGTIARAARWPGWTPPPAMIERDPSLAKWADGMPGGVDNPLGARALYINFGGADSGYRIHGTNSPTSIGWAASSGCFRMLNQDVIDLYDRVEIGAKVVVL